MLHAPIPHRLIDDAEPPPRQCGRCRLMFAGDPTLYYPPGCLPCPEQVYLVPIATGYGPEQDRTLWPPAWRASP